MYTLTETQIRDILTSAVAIGVKKGLMLGKVQEVVLKSHIAKSEAYELYGRRRVDAWIKAGKVREIKTGTGNNAHIRIDRIELDIVNTSINF